MRLFRFFSAGYHRQKGLHTQKIWVHLEPESRETVLSLHKVPLEPDTRKLWSIFGADALEISLNGGDETYHGLFKLACKINHIGVPSSHLSAARTE